MSPHFNCREDRWGGSLANRMRFALAVVEAVRQAIKTTADRPFLLGYRISPEEQNEGGLRMQDSLELVDRLVDAKIDYLHASLSNALDAMPIGSIDGPTVPAILLSRVAGRIPLIAAGQVQTPSEAERVLDSGLSLVAVGQGLVMNPAWVELALSDRQDHIAKSIGASDLEHLAIPAKLWAVIEATTRWFKIRQPALDETAR